MTSKKKLRRRIAELETGIGPVAPTYTTLLVDFVHRTVKYGSKSIHVDTDAVSIPVLNGQLPWH